MSRLFKRGNLKFYDNYNWYVPGVKGILGLVALFLVGVILANIVTLLLGQEYATLVGYPLMFIPAMIYASSASSRRAINTKGMKVDGFCRGSSSAVILGLLAVVITLCSAFCVDALMMVMPQMPEQLEALLNSMTQGNFLVNFICVSIFAPFFEEWLCRGMVLRGLLGNNTKPVWAIVISALFFAVIHANPWQAVPAFILGCLFGYVYYKTGSLKLTMLMHFANNTFALIMSNIDSFKEVDNWMDILPGMRYWIIFAACLMLVILSLNVFRRIPLGRSQGNLEEVISIFEDDTV